MTNGAGELRVASVASEPARRLDALQCGKIKGANRLQLVCERGLPETVGQVVEPRLVLILKVEQGAYRILPALRSGSAVLRSSVMQLRLRCLVALSITPLSLGVGQSHGHCAPLRNGCGRCGRGQVCGVDLGSRGALAGAFVVDGGAPPIAFDVEFEDGGTVHQAVDGGDGHGGLGEDLVPLAERLVGGDQQGALLVTCADQFEQDAGLGLILGDVGKIIEHEEVKLVELPDGGLECQLAACGLQALSEIGGASEQHAVAVLDES